MLLSECGSGLLLRPFRLHNVESQRRGLAVTAASLRRRGPGGDGKPDVTDLNKLMADEKKGFFRVLDIGLPKHNTDQRPRRQLQEQLVKAPPRYTWGHLDGVRGDILEHH